MVKVKNFFFLAAAVFLLDTVTKIWVEKVQPQIDLTSWFGIKFTTNTGISFGLLKNQPLIPLLVSVAVLIGIIYYYKQMPMDWRVQSGVALLFAGTLGNLTDRILYGHVIDFLDFKFWPAFNIADSAICVGAVLLIIYMIKEKN